ETKLHAEVSDGVLLQRRRVLGAPRVLLSRIRVKSLKHLANAVSKIRVLKSNPQLVVGNLMQNGHRIVIEVLPAAWGKFLKDFLGFLVPRPPEVARQAV